MKKTFTIEEINKIIDDELEFAKQVNQQMAFGMLQIKQIINKKAMEENNGQR